MSYQMFPCVALMAFVLLFTNVCVSLFGAHIAELRSGHGFKRRSSSAEGAMKLIGRLPGNLLVLRLGGSDAGTLFRGQLEYGGVRKS